MSIRTLRGRLDALETRQLVVDDGRFRNGFIIRDFNIVGVSGNVTIDSVVMAFNQVDLGSQMNFERPQIAWGFQDENATIWSHWEENRIVQTDLWIRNNDADQKANYIIVLEPYELKADQGVLNLIKERQQATLE